MEIYDEVEYAENLIKHGFKYNNVSLVDLTILGKYYIYKEFPLESIRAMLIKFCYLHRKGFNEIIFGDTIEKAVKASKKTPIRIPVPVKIYVPEIEKIRVLKNHRLEKILFVMLCLSKFDYENRKKNKTKETTSRLFVNTTFSSILNMSKVHAVKKEQVNIVLMFCNDKFIKSAGKDNANNEKDSYEILFAEEGELFTIINKPSDILNYYPLYCLECKKEISKNSKRKDYCKECWRERQKELWKNNSNTYYNKNKILS